MGFDRKYGRVTTEHGTIGEDEPVVVFRAQDKLLPAVLAHYERLCMANGSPIQHLDGVAATRRRVAEWQDTHRTQIPQSAGGVVLENADVPGVLDEGDDKPWP